MCILIDVHEKKKEQIWSSTRSVIVMEKEPASLFLYDINCKTQQWKCGDKM